MLIFISGTDSFLASRAIHQIKDKYLAKNDGAELIEISPDSAQINWADLQAVPLFATSRLVIVRSAGKFIKEHQDNLAAILKNLPDTTVAVVWDDKPIPAQNALHGVLQAASRVIEASPLVSTTLERYVAKLAKASGLEPTKTLVAGLVGAHGSDLWAIQSELAYLINGGELTATNKKAVAEPFAVFNYIRANNWKKVGEHIASELNQGMPIEVIIGGVASAVRKEVRDSATKQQVTDYLVDIDMALKTGALDDQAAAALLVSYLPKPPSGRVQWEDDEG